jgi:hypothetical protein
MSLKGYVIVGRHVKYVLEYVWSVVMYINNVPVEEECIR